MILKCQSLGIKIKLDYTLKGALIKTNIRTNGEVCMTCESLFFSNSQTVL